MNLFKRTPKKLPQNSERLLVEPEAMENPQSVADYLRRGYAFYARSKFPQAEDDFRKAISLDPHSVDSIYALGMTLKAEKKIDESVQTFKQAIAIIKSGVLEDKIRGDMLKRLAMGHINEMTEGDWNLEKEIWQRNV